MTLDYAPSPRPTFDGPAHIPYESVTRHLWGDAESGEVADWIYVSSERIHQIVFGLPPGGAFRHSQQFRTVFAADEVLYVLSGVMVIANPETGEVQKVMPGEAAFFRRDTWHHVFNMSTDELRVLEMFAPPPAAGTSGAYARTRPYLESPTYARADLLGRWPLPASDGRVGQTIHVIRPADLLWRLQGSRQQVLLGLMASTEHLTVGVLEIQPGGSSDGESHGGDESMYVLEGSLNVEILNGDGPRWSELKPTDGYYIPMGVPHRYCNFSARPVRALIAVAPSFDAL
jgi:mannose-6-phosphate isomerase-like protein (cupin superfamily)